MHYIEGRNHTLGASMDQRGGKGGGMGRRNRGEVVGRGNRGEGDPQWPRSGHGESSIYIYIYIYILY